MNQEEFKSRTKNFLTAEEIRHYDDWYEPAYMTAEGIDKDDFCSMLKDEKVRIFVREMSKGVQRHEAQNAALRKEAGQREKLIQAYNEDISAYRKALLLISATCDRAGVQWSEN